MPVVETFAGKGSVQEDAWFGLGGLGLEGNPGANEIARDADVVIAVGTRLTDFATGSHSLFQHPHVRFIAVNVDGRDAHKAGALPVVADAREALLAMNDCGRRSPRRAVPRLPRARSTTARDAWRDAARGARRPHPGRADEPGRADPGDERSGAAGRHVLTAAGTPPGDLLKIWDATGGRDCHLEFGFSCMGYELPAAVGVRLARPERRGDRLRRRRHVPAQPRRARHRAAARTEDHRRDLREPRLPEHPAAADGRASAGTSATSSGTATASGRLDGAVVELDLARSAEGLGARTWRASTADEVRAALAEAREEPSRPCVIVCETEPHRYLPDAGVWWDVAPAEVSRPAGGAGPPRRVRARPRRAAALPVLSGYARPRAAQADALTIRSAGNSSSAASRTTASRSPSSRER